jgi:hypothetical protein
MTTIRESFLSLSLSLSLISLLSNNLEDNVCIRNYNQSRVCTFHNTLSSLKGGSVTLLDYWFPCAKLYSEGVLLLFLNSKREKTPSKLGSIPRMDCESGPNLATKVVNYVAHSQSKNC